MVDAALRSLCQPRFEATLSSDSCCPFLRLCRHCAGLRYTTLPIPRPRQNEHATAARLKTSFLYTYKYECNWKHHANVRRQRIRSAVFDKMQYSTCYSHFCSKLTVSCRQVSHGVLRLHLACLRARCRPKHRRTFQSCVVQQAQAVELVTPFYTVHVVIRHKQLKLS